MLEKKKILVTGSSGFIGYHLCRYLLNNHDVKIVGLDNMNDYYDVSLKESRLNELVSLNKDFIFTEGDLTDRFLLEALFKEYDFDIVVNLAAQAGVRYSLKNPEAYINSNIIGFFNLIDVIRNNNVEHFVYASSSSVYGGNTKVPFSIEDKVDRPVSLYAATKKTDELIAHTYSHLYGMNTTGLRFFTVYGPYGRPDMAYFSFTEKLLKGEKIKVFNYGNCERDFTYIDDIVEGIVKILDDGPKEKYNLYNIGNNHPENLLVFIRTLSECLVDNGLVDEDFNIDDHIELVEMQKGDVVTTYADVSALERDYGFRPDTPLKEGLNRFAKWYKDYYKK